MNIQTGALCGEGTESRENYNKYINNDEIHKTHNLYLRLILLGPVTVAERSEECAVFARSEAEIAGSNPTQGMDVWCVCAFFCICVVLCLVRGLATSWSPVQGVLPSVNYQETEKSDLCSKMGASPQVGASGSKKNILLGSSARHIVRIVKIRISYILVEEP
jgi:hypothetical protein